MNRYRTYLDDKPKPVVEDPGAKIAQDIKAYLAKGGKVTDVPRGVSKWTPLASIRPKERPVERSDK